MTEICPYIRICPIYENWVEQTKDNRLDVISKNIKEMYECLAKNALEHPITEGGTEAGPLIRGRLKNLSSECSHITIKNDRKTNRLNA